MDTVDSRYSELQGTSLKFHYKRSFTISGWSAHKCDVLFTINSGVTKNGVTITRVDIIKIFSLLLLS